MDRKMYAPWREEYILGPKEKGCLFCRIFREEKDRQNYVLYRGEKVFVVMNRYPYVSGHLMVVPNRHIAHIEKLPRATSEELMYETQRAVKILKQILQPHSLNIGINLGHQSGAGVPGHLHQHIVPRWHGDTNFLSVIGNTRVVSVSLTNVYRQLVKPFQEIEL
ncbi:MAG TPA: HIT domain-containing protein [candidate division Zixibacteria bacterium]|nr:HIT domain-containing protein [candidate division Zixibacteria bacterium]